MQYFVLPHCNIAFNAKVGSSTLACAIVKKYYPDRLKKVLADHERTWSQFSQAFKDSLPESFQRMLRNDKLDSVAFWQNICVRTNQPVGRVLLPVREPIERFKSTVAYLEMDIEKTLDALENDGEMVIDVTSVNVRRNTHYLTQSCLATGDTTFYRFPHDLARLCDDAGLDWPLEYQNEGKHKKPDLTSAQEDRVRAYYAQDIELYKSLDLVT